MSTLFHLECLLNELSTRFRKSFTDIMPEGSNLQSRKRYLSPISFRPVRIKEVFPYLLNPVTSVSLLDLTNL